MLDISAIILKETPIDIIIGRDTIKKYQFFDKIPSQLRGNDLIQEDITVRKGSKQCECQPKGGSKQPSLIAPTECGSKCHSNTIQKHSLHLLPSLGYMSSRDSLLVPSEHHLTFSKLRSLLF